MKMLKRKRFFAGLLVLLLAALGLNPISAQPSGETLTVVTYDSFAISEAVQAQFEAETGITLRILRLADAGSMVNQSIISRNNPLGDVLYGVDNTFLGRALGADLFLPYESLNLEAVPEAFQLDAGEYRVTPVTYGDVCLNYDMAYFEETGLPLPTTLQDLTDPMYRSLLVVQNPAGSSPGLAFLLTTVAVFGEPADDNAYSYLDYWADLVANDLLVVEGWSEAYYQEFSAAGSGSRPLVVSYASSPPAEVLFADPPTDEAPTGVIVNDETCFRQVEFVGILQGTQKLEAAQQFVDFTLSLAFQEDLPLQMFVFPVHEAAELPEVFVEYAQIPENPVSLTFEQIEAGRDTWIEAWTQTVLR